MSARVLGLRGALELHHSQALSLKQKNASLPSWLSAPLGTSERLRFHQCVFSSPSIPLSLSSPLILPFFCFHSGKEQEDPPSPRHLVTVPELLKTPAPHLGSGRRLSICSNGLQLNFLLFALLHCRLLHHLLFLLWAGSPGRSAGKKPRNGCLLE